MICLTLIVSFDGNKKAFISFDIQEVLCTLGEVVNIFIGFSVLRRKKKLQLTMSMNVGRYL